MIEIDATFNTNSQKLLLFVAVGITNTNRTFPMAFLFATSELEIAFSFFYNILKEELFNNCPPPRVNLSDQAKGLAACLPNKLPACQPQYCNWYIAENLKARVGKSSRGYPTKIKGEVHDAAWNWIKSPTSEALLTNREALTSLLFSAEKEYFYDFWERKEDRFVACYTTNYRNLGANSI